MANLAIVTALALLQYMLIGFVVAKARGKYGIKPPATSGHEIFDRTFRVQQNTLEQMVAFLPALWLFGSYVSYGWGAMLGLAFIVGRTLYAIGYIASPEKRGPGFMIGLAANAVLVIGGLIGAIRAAL
jgi:glutathione S-transferase